MSPRVRSGPYILIGSDRALCIFRGTCPPLLTPILPTPTFLTPILLTPLFLTGSFSSLTHLLTISLSSAFVYKFINIINNGIVILYRIE